MAETVDNVDNAETMGTRERILRETWRMLEERRGQSVRLEDIARAAGVSRQAIYLHFGSRAELFIQTVRYVDQQLHAEERMLAACQAEDDQALPATIAWWASYIPDIYGLAKALVALREKDEAAVAAWADRMQALYQGCTFAVRAIERDGSLAPGWSIEMAADFLWALLSIDTWERLTVDRGWSREQYTERMQRVASRVLIR